MDSIIQRFAVPTLTNAQQFAVKLLCGILLPIKILALLFLRDKNKVVINVKEYYEQRSGRNWKTIDRLQDENISLTEENKSLKAQISALQLEKSVLLGKVKSRNNMMRILTKTRESASSCKTPVKINVSDVDCLLRKKLNESTVGPKHNKHVFPKPPPVTVVHKKDVKKVAMPKVKVNVACAKNTQQKDTNKPKPSISLPLKEQTRVLARKPSPMPTRKPVVSLPLTKQTKIVPKKPSPTKSVMLYKGKENLGSNGATLRIVTKAAGVKKPSPTKSVMLYKGKENLGSNGATLRIVTKAAGVKKPEQKNISVKSKHLEPKNSVVKIDENLNTTYVVDCQ